MSEPILRLTMKPSTVSPSVRLHLVEQRSLAPTAGVEIDPFRADAHHLFHGGRIDVSVEHLDLNLRFGDLLLDDLTFVTCSVIHRDDVPDAGLGTFDIECLGGSQHVVPIEIVAVRGYRQQF